MSVKTTTITLILTAAFALIAERLTSSVGQKILYVVVGFVAYCVILGVVLKWRHMDLEHAYRMEMLRTATVKVEATPASELVFTKRNHSGAR